MCRPPGILAKARQRTARRSVLHLLSAVSNQTWLVHSELRGACKSNVHNMLGVQSPKNSISPSPRFEEKGSGDEEPDDSHLAHPSPCQT